MSGEKPGRREQINQFVSHLVSNGAKPEYAKQKAREQAIKADRKDKR